MCIMRGHILFRQTLTGLRTGPVTDLYYNAKVTVVLTYPVPMACVPMIGGWT